MEKYNGDGDAECGGVGTGEIKSFVLRVIMRRRQGWDSNPSRAVPEPTVLQHRFWKQVRCGVERNWGI